MTRRMLYRSGMGIAIAGRSFLAVVTVERPAASQARPASVEASGCDAKALAVRGVAIQTAAMVDVGQASEHCHVEGEAMTEGEGAAQGSAGFVLDLPARWNGKLLFDGGGGLNGYLPQPKKQYLAEGYAALGTDGGHRSANPMADVAWMKLPSGAPNETAITDYLHRAIPQVNLRVRPIVSRYYGGEIRRAYFMGCSNGGREALFQSQHSTQLFDGFIAGDPSVAPALGLPELWRVKVLRDAPISYAQMPAVDAEIMAQCDTADGLKDGLIQNPAACNFDPQKLVRKGIVTAPQGVALARYLTAIHDDSGEFVEPGSALSGVGEITPYPGFSRSITGIGGYETAVLDPASPPEPGRKSEQEDSSSALVGALSFNDPGIDLLGPTFFAPNGLFRHSAVERVTQRWRPGLATVAGMSDVFAKGRKVLIYHGMSDHDTSPFESQIFYTKVAQANGGLEKTARSMRLFMVPGMQHCGSGQGPNDFDALAAMDAWVEHGQAPTAIIATKYANSKPDFSGNAPKGAAERSMPLCPFPGIASYDGTGKLSEAKSWTCRADDRTLLKIGSAGRAAGLE
jgi:feruloyl esterase